MIDGFDRLLSRCAANTPVALRECAADSYAQWLATDAHLTRVLRQRGTSHRKLDVLRNALTNYGVARNLPSRYDVGEGIPRLAPVLDALEMCRPRKGKAFDPVVLVNDLSSAIGQHYGGRQLTSLASKIGWAAYGSPIVIYDSYARNALDVPTRDYATYYMVWRRVYDDGYRRIQKVAARYLKDEWFTERVFDMMLWRVGDARRRKARPQ